MNEASVEKANEPANTNESSPRRLGRVLNFRVDAAQETELRDKAAQAGLSVSDFIRRAAFAESGPPRRRPKATGKDERDFALVLAALQKIGVNLNQIARVSNTQKHVSFEEFRMLKSLQTELQETRAALLHCFGEDE